MDIGNGHRSLFGGGGHIPNALRSLCRREMDTFGMASFVVREGYTFKHATNLLAFVSWDWRFLKHLCINRPISNIRK